MSREGVFWRDMNVLKSKIFLFSIFNYDSEKADSSAYYVSYGGSKILSISCYNCNITVLRFINIKKKDII
jgi:hypothetical protein